MTCNSFIRMFVIGQSRYSMLQAPCILKMMNHMLGDELFIGGLRTYLKKREFSEATEQDLWADIQQVARFRLFKLNAVSSKNGCSSTTVIGQKSQVQIARTSSAISPRSFTCSCHSCDKCMSEFLCSIQRLL